MVLSNGGATAPAAPLLLTPVIPYQSMAKPSRKTATKMTCITVKVTSLFLLCISVHAMHAPLARKADTDHCLEAAGQSHRLATKELAITVVVLFYI